MEHQGRGLLSNMRASKLTSEQDHTTYLYPTSGFLLQKSRMPPYNLIVTSSSFFARASHKWSQGADVADMLLTEGSSLR